jgi:hypothetical protein
MAVLGSAPSPVTGAEEPFGRVARLAALVLGVPSSVFVAVAGGQLFPRGTCPGWRAVAGQQAPGELSLCQRVIESGGGLVVEDARVDPRTPGSCPAGSCLAGSCLAGSCLAGRLPGWGGGGGRVGRVPGAQPGRSCCRCAVRG